MSKEATVYVLDLGSTMGDCHNGRVETDLEYAMKYVYDKMADDMSDTRVKSLFTGVVGFRTDETSNDLDEEEGYGNISVLQPLANLTMPIFNELREKIFPSQTEFGDAVSAIVVAVDMITKYTTLKSGKPGSYVRKVILVTDGQGAIDDEFLDIRETGIKLTVMGVDFDDPEIGFKEEDKSTQKSKNEEVLRGLVEKCEKESLFATAAEVIDSLSEPKVKTMSRILPNYKGTLCQLGVLDFAGGTPVYICSGATATALSLYSRRPYADLQTGLGDPEKYPETSVLIDVERFPKTKAAKPVSAKSITIHGGANGGPSTQSSNTLPGDVEMTDAPTEESATVKTARTYEVKDPALGKKNVDRDDLAKGFEYGRTAVPVAESDENVTKLETKQGFSIIGFVEFEKYEQYFTMGEANITVALRVNDKARVALSSFIHALHDLATYAVARLVTKDGKDPQILLLAPYIELEIEGLIDIPLPFAEDIRMYRFPPLDRVITASGATLDKHRYLPSHDLDTAMSDYVDSMDLSTLGDDEESEPAEYMSIDKTFSPTVHRINQAIRHRAIYDGPVQPPADVLTKWSKPPSELVSKSKPYIKKLIAAADVKKVPPKVKGKRGRGEVPKPLSGLDIESLLIKHKPDKTISRKNAIAEFKQALDSADADETVFKAVDDMGEIVREILQGTGDANDQEAQANIKVMRDSMIDFEFPDKYNDFIRDLKKGIVKQEFGGNRNEFWHNLRFAKLGLIDITVLPESEISPEETKEFYSLAKDLPNRARKD